MPDKPTYLHRLTSILAEAKTPKPIPFFRRCDIEALFGLKRRQAINLMHRIGAVRVSQEIAIRQRDLVSWLLLLLGLHGRLSFAYSIAWTIVPDDAWTPH